MVLKVSKKIMADTKVSAQTVEKVVLPQVINFTL